MLPITKFGWRVWYKVVGKPIPTYDYANFLDPEMPRLDVRNVKGVWTLYLYTTYFLAYLNV